MSFNILKGKQCDIKLWTPVNEVESGALDQLKNMASLPWVAHMAVMPDVHLGKGATVGSVIGMRGAVSPAAVGVDIGCGMGAIKTNLKASQLPDSLHDLRLAIEASIPVGFNAHSSAAYRKVRDDKVRLRVQKLLDNFKNLDDGVQDLGQKVWNQLGTLGGGNHFIELCLDSDDNVWMMLHSGSRNIGKSLAEIHMGRARGLEHSQKLVDRDLAVFLSGTPEMQAYRRDLYWAQDYAMANRLVMFELYKYVMESFFPTVEFEEAILCHHNYVSEEFYGGEQLMVTRKGAIRAGYKDMGIIPGSMGTCSYIVEGLGNDESMCSASHGAGRKMSRGAAKRMFSEADIETQTAGVECRKDSGIIDELPGAYKDIDKVMENQSDLVRVVTKLKQVLCVKG